MLINLSDVLSEQHKTIEKDVAVDMTVFEAPFGRYEIVSKDLVHIVVEHVKDSELMIRGLTDLVIAVPCDRCLEEVDKAFHFNFAKNVDLNPELVDTQKEFDEKNYIDGYNLDVDKLLYNEILIGWPMKVLCSENCKGICSICGQNLNKGTCDCEDTGLDPRMSVIQDVFKNFKEV